MKSSITRAFGLALGAAGMILGATGPAQAAGNLSVQEATSIATDAYVYGYSLVTTDVTRIQMWM